MTALFVGLALLAAGLALMLTTGIMQWLSAVTAHRNAQATSVLKHCGLLELEEVDE